ncbi:potassium-transporting ATPase subunit KdpA [Brevundimonas bacteroides]|uniref:potassium-transporting ATPase subunit KdpA n=1 Tax=Brevundimonas bacteroides TaxID=74311 RepID=UPI0004960306|nr:potassium-transporting ATPase subunit KdpA [Brevundimonas bacteroides]
MGSLALLRVLRLNALLPLYTQGYDGLTPRLAFSSVVRVATNTNGQSYGGETMMSTLGRMLGLTTQNVLSVATRATIAAKASATFRPT